MKDLFDIYNELDCIADNLNVLAAVSSPDNDVSMSPAVLADAIYAASQHIERIIDDIEAIDLRSRIKTQGIA